MIDYQGKDYPRNIRVDDAQYQVGNWGSYKSAVYLCHQWQAVLGAV